VTVGLLKSPTIAVLVSICAFMSSSVYLMHLGVPILGECKLTIVISS
jgi:hypothetical protein